MTFTLTVDDAAVRGMADRIDELASRALLRLSAIDAVNEVAVRVDKQARAAMNAGLNLTDAYVSSLMSISPAAPGSGKVARAQITALGKLTVLSHFPYRQLTQEAAGARGDPKRGIGAGLKQAGIAVEITRGLQKFVPHYFTMTLRRGAQAGETVGVFYRDSSGNLTHKYGPSPYSLFRHQINTHSAEYTDDLERTATARMADTITKALS